MYNKPYHLTELTLYIYHKATYGYGTKMLKTFGLKENPILFTKSKR